MNWRVVKNDKVVIRNEFGLIKKSQVMIRHELEGYKEWQVCEQGRIGSLKENTEFSRWSITKDN
jgi:hypothetical protein